MLPRSSPAEFSGNDRFTVVRRLGMGGMGVVYEALDRERDQRVALKTLRSMSPEALLRLKQEFRSIQDLGHPNLVTLGELHGEGADWFFTMELVDGIDFLAWVRPPDHPSSSDSADFLLRRTDVSPSATTMPEFLSPRGGGSRGEHLDEARLRPALAQLCRGLIALHEAGKVHRDIKPSNVLVAPQAAGGGRVVLLDFGLTTGLTRSEQLEGGDAGQVVGTIEYMSPEQAAARPVGPETDWYSVGVMLYEALTGQVPFSGNAMQVLTDKQRLEPEAPSRVAEGVPPDLERLCLDLLRFHPPARPTGKQLLERLGERPMRDRGSMPSRTSLTISQAFVGRREELAALERAFQTTRAGRAAVVAVTGESGIGKSALVQRYVASVQAAHPDAVVLLGRCYERESVPYKAVDGAVDALSRYLVRLPRADAAALLPRHAALLAEVFPVLSRVEAVADAPSPPHRVLDRQELRGRVFAALRELLGRVADRHPVVMVIDDLQWADADSLALVGELLREPDAPPLLLIATARPQSGVPLALPGPAVEVTLARLQAEEALELGRRIGRTLAPRESIDIEALVAEAGGHPLFLDELIRFTLLEGGGARPVQLEDALGARIAELDEPARRLLELVALYGGPMLQQTAAQASGLGGEFGKLVALLRVQHLVRTTGMRATDRIETYHDRVRAAVAHGLDEATRAGHHRRLAVALETSQQADPESLYHHWRGAGVPAKAAHYARAGAAKAERALAFDRAARLYAECIALEADDPDRTRELKVKLGDAMANAGRGADSAEAYLEASRGANAAESVDLRRRAAEQLLRSGHIARGLEVTDDVLKTVGMRLAPTPTRAMASVLTQRARLRLRGLSFSERDPSQISATDLTRIDVCWSVGVGLAMVDTIRGTDFQTRNLRLALEAGEPYRIARALSMEAVYAGTPGTKGVKRTRTLLEASAKLAASGRHPHLLGLSKMASGVAAFLEGRYAEARRVCEEAEQIFRERCTGVAWELAFNQAFILWALYFLGEVQLLQQRVPVLVQGAEERGDLYALTNLRTEFVTLVAMTRDREAEARAAIDEAMREWTNEGFHLEHAWEVHARAQVDLYAGKAGDAFERVSKSWRALERSLTLQIQQLRIEFLYLRGRSALALAARAPEIDRLRAIAVADAKRMQGTGAPWAQPLARVLLGAAAALGGDERAAAEQLTRAIPELEAGSMLGHAAAVRLRLAELADDETAKAQHLAWLTERQVANPRRWARMLVPPVRRG